MNIAIDIGGVAVERALAYESDSTSFDIEFKTNFIAVITMLCDLGHTLFFNSYCGQKREGKTRNDFRLVNDLVSAIPESNWHFVRKRKRKADVCDTIQADIMIDDTLNICVMLKEYGVKHVFWFSNDESHSDLVESLQIIQVKSWDEIYQKICDLKS